MGQQAKQVALRYTWDVTAEQVAEVYERLWVDKKGHGGP